jgi:hypothetical protein
MSPARARIVNVVNTVMVRDQHMAAILIVLVS